MASVPRTKVCSKCGEAKAISEYYVKIKASGRLFSWCKACQNRMTREHYRKDLGDSRARAREWAREWRKENQALARAKDARNYQANREKLAAAARERNKTNQDRRRAYKAANAERLRAEAAEYRERNREELRRKNNDYYLANRDEVLRRGQAWRAANRERWLESVRRAKEKQRENLKAAAHRRRARQRGNGGSHTPAEWAAIKERQDHCCLACGRREPEIKLTVDHVVPISKGGRDDAANLQALCFECNNRKMTRSTDYREA
jgi:5-methylcytosine-specific restriction endonuclease McrA